MPDKWQGQFIKSATEETDPQPVCLTKGGVPAIVQCGTENQGSGFYAETKLLAEGVQLDTPCSFFTKSCPPTSFSNEFIASENRGLSEEDNLFAAFPKCRSVCEPPGSSRSAVAPCRFSHQPIDLIGRLNCEPTL